MKLNPTPEFVFTSGLVSYISQVLCKSKAFRSYSACLKKSFIKKFITAEDKQENVCISKAHSTHTTKHKFNNQSISVTYIF